MDNKVDFYNYINFLGALCSKAVKPHKDVLPTTEETTRLLKCLEMAAALCDKNVKGWVRYPREHSAYPDHPHRCFQPAPAAWTIHQMHQNAGTVSRHICCPKFFQAENLCHVVLSVEGAKEFAEGVDAFE